MSIVRATLRICAVMALRDNTLALARVYDSQNTPLVQALSAATEPLPYIVVYTDNDAREEMEGNDIYQSDRLIGLAVEVAMASGINQGEIVLPHTDPAMELICDFVESQVFSALFGDARNEWSEIIRRLVTHVRRVTSTRGGRAQQGVRFAARHTTFVCNTIADLPVGVVPDAGHVMLDFVTLAKTLPAEDDIRKAAEAIEAMLSTDAHAVFEQDQSWLGLTREGIRATGMAPVIAGADYGHEAGSSIVGTDGEPYQLEQVNVDQDDKDGERLEVKPE